MASNQKQPPTPATIRASDYQVAQMALRLLDYSKLSVEQIRALHSRFSAPLGLPFATLADACEAIAPAQRYQGLQVQVYGTGMYYWWPTPDLSDKGLVKHDPVL